MSRLAGSFATSCTADASAAIANLALCNVVVFIGNFENSATAALITFATLASTSFTEANPQMASPIFDSKHKFWIWSSTAPYFLSQAMTFDKATTNICEHTPFHEKQNMYGLLHANIKITTSDNRIQLDWRQKHDQNAPV
jgi:hypothetical protein